jgi:large subunit ribosomal protein L30
VTEAGKKTDARADAGREKKSSGTTTLKLRLVKSGICTPKDQKATLKGIGFRRLGEELTRVDSPSLRGMLRKVRHLVEVESK